MTQRHSVPRWFALGLILALVGLVSQGAASAQQQTVTVFQGTPQFRINELGVERAEALSRQVAADFAVVISKIGDDYYWASRENLPLVEVDGGGAFVTYVAANGSGYVRVIKPEMKAVASLPGGASARYDYVEHLLLGLTSVTYYGIRVTP